MRVGVVGLGRIGLVHARHAAQHPDVEEVVLLDRDAGQLDGAARALGLALAPGAPAVLAGRWPGTAAPATVSRTTDLAAALPGLDALVVATSTPSHPALARAAVAAGVPALVEKPLSADPDEWEVLAADLTASGVPVAVGFHRRHDPACVALRELVVSGALGAVRTGRAVDADRTAVALEFIPTSGGIWRDLFIHHLDLVPWVLDEPVVRLTAFASVLDEPRLAALGDFDTATAVLEMASGAVVTVAGSRHNEAGQDVRLEISGTLGSAAVGLDARTPLTSTEPGATAPVDPHRDFAERFEPAFRAEVDHFLRLARGEAEDVSPPGAGLAALRLAVAAEESVRTGAAVRTA